MAVVALRQHLQHAANAVGVAGTFARGKQVKRTDPTGQPVAGIGGADAPCVLARRQVSSTRNWCAQVVARHERRGEIAMPASTCTR